MLFTDKLIFLHLQKTGGTHVGRLLARYFDVHTQGSHTGLVGDIARPFVLMGIRNPWDWYVSLWAYGCQGDGAIHDYLVSGRGKNAAFLAKRHVARPSEWGDWLCHFQALSCKDSTVWRDLYRDPEDPARFRQWLRTIHEPPGYTHTGEDYSALPLHHTLGLMSARYLKISSRAQTWHEHRGRIRSIADARLFCRDYGVATHFIRTESLEEDLACALADLGVPVVAEELREGRTNRSKHHDSNYYYDAETVDLVARRDRLIIERHGYVYPTASKEP